MIVDSNLIIYSIQPAYPGLRRMVSADTMSVSAITIVEVLGYHKLTQLIRAEFEKFFAAANVTPVTDTIVASAVALRQAHKMSLGDSLIAATAVVSGRKLLTHNVKDFAWIPGLVVVDPLADGDPA